MRILIADDDNVCSQALAMHLTLLGDIEIAASGRGAIECIREAISQGRPFGLIFLDILMPEGDGQDVLRQLRASEAVAGLHGLRGAKVVMTTCLDDRRQIMNAFRGQAEAYLVKPVEPARLREVLRDFGILGREV